MARCHRRPDLCRRDPRPSRPQRAPHRSLGRQPASQTPGLARPCARLAPLPATAFRYVTLGSGPMPARPLGDKPMTNAQRQARHRAARATARPVIHYRRAGDRRSRAQRWRDAPGFRRGRLAELVALQAEYRAWLEALPDRTAPPPKPCRPSTSSTSTNSKRSNRPGASAGISQLHSRVAPVGKQATSRARRCVAREGTARRARDPPVRYRDNPPAVAHGVLFARRAPAFCAPIGTLDRHSANAKNAHASEAPNPGDIIS